MSQVVISIQHVSKKYVIGSQKDGSLRGTLAGLFVPKKNQQEEFWALKDVSFDIQKGDVVGIIGKNGAGKSTLLKILSQITKPTDGRIALTGRVASLLEVGTGFHPELTGRENVFLNGTILGMTRKEVSAKFDEIVAFSGVEKFIDTPVKHYSSGMYVRLAFAVAAHLEPEILIIDEVLAVGDAEFQKKCLGKMKDVAGEGRTVIFVSHHLGSIRQLCNKGVLLEKGEMKKMGLIEDVITAYQETGNDNFIFKQTSTVKPVYVSEAKFQEDKTVFSSQEELRFNFDITFNDVYHSGTAMLLRIFDKEEQVVGATEVKIKSHEKRYSYTLPANLLTKGRYSLNVVLYQPAVIQFDVVETCLTFEITDNNEQLAHLETFNIGNVYLPNTWG